MVRFIQMNLNNSRVAQDLLMQNMREGEVEVAIISEINFVPRTSEWIVDSSARHIPEK